jgi:hypothetical protein
MKQQGLRVKVGNGWFSIHDFLEQFGYNEDPEALERRESNPFERGSDLDTSDLNLDDLMKKGKPSTQ